MNSNELSLFLKNVLDKGYNLLRRSRQAILELLEDLGRIPEDICSRVNTEEDTEILRRWHKVAAKAESFADFQEKMN